jgi:hypothetical protein
MYSDQQGLAAPSPPYSTSTSSQGTYMSPDPAIDMAQRAQVTAGQQPMQPPPASMFDFVSPFEVLSNGGTGSIKQKKNPTQPAAAISSEDSGSWTTVSDPKRQSVDNLLESLTRQGPPMTYEPYTGPDYSQLEQPRAIPPPTFPKVPNQPPPRTQSPRASPPKTQAVAAARGQGGRFLESPSSQQGNNGRHNKESSPGPKERRKNGPVGQGKGQGNKAQSSPGYALSLTSIHSFSESSPTVPMYRTSFLMSPSHWRKSRRRLIMSSRPR